MKGFYIQITNNLLDPKHVKRMGAAVWEYMWCLDKMTSISEEGVGKVLGGKPIKWREVRADLGKHEVTISENMSRLRDEGYISLLRTPYGNVIHVFKAKKHFKKTSENTKNKEDVFSKTSQNDVSEYQGRASKEARNPKIRVTKGMTHISDLLK